MAGLAGALMPNGPNVATGATPGRRSDVRDWVVVGGVPGGRRGGAAESGRGGVESPGARDRGVVNTLSDERAKPMRLRTFSARTR